MKRIILISMIMMHIFFNGSEQFSSEKRPQEFVENKKERYEYVIIRAVKEHTICCKY